MSLEEIRKKWELIEEEDAKIRSKMANWEFIDRQKPLIKNALIYYIKTGDIRRACKMAKMGINAFRELLRKANIPVIT
ncbi:MAG: hypothetical protein Q6363_007025 [Candidatus Njordarchaeota archaeon]